MNPVDDFLKTAGFMDTLRGLGTAFRRGLGGGSNRTLAQAAMEGAGQVLPGAIVGTALVAGGTGISKGIGAISNKFTKARDYKAMVGANPALKKFDAGQVQMVYNSLRSHSSSMAKDPLIAGSFVRKTLEVSPESGPFIDPQTVKLLAESQRNVSQARDSRGGIADAFRSTQLYPVNPDPFDMGGRREQGRQFDAQMEQRKKQHEGKFPK